MPSYFCHQCNTEYANSEVSNDDVNLTVTCSRCGTDFLEEINDSNRQDLLLPNAGEAPASHQLRIFLQHLQHQDHHHQQQQPVSVFNFGLHRMMDFLDSGALDQVMTQLLGQVDGNGGAPPPATQRQLAMIKTACITEKQVKEGLQCFVCLDEFKQDASAEVLPCQHHFHQQCIRPWLEKRGTCPVCRSPLSPAAPGDDEGAPDENAEAVDEAAPPGAVGGLWSSNPSAAFVTGLAASSAAAAAAAASGASTSTTESRQAARRGRRRRSRDYVEDDCD